MKVLLHICPLFWPGHVYYASEDKEVILLIQGSKFELERPEIIEIDLPLGRERRSRDSY